MKIQPYVTKMNNSPEYKQFIKQNSDPFLAAGFLIIDYESGNNVHQIDLYVPSKKKVATRIRILTDIQIHFPPL